MLISRKSPFIKLFKRRYLACSILHLFLNMGCFSLFSLFFIFLFFIFIYIYFILSYFFSSFTVLLAFTSFFFPIYPFPFLFNSFLVCIVGKVACRCSDSNWAAQSQYGYETGWNGYRSHWSLNTGRKRSVITIESWNNRPERSAYHMQNGSHRG